MAEPISSMPLLTKMNYHPSGGTALLDAIGQTSSLLSEYNHNEPDIPTTFVVVVLTDGYENSSTFYNLVQVRSMIQQFEATGKWTFSFIGATLDAVDIATEMSIRPQNSFYFAKESMQEAVWDKLSGSMSRYFNKKQKGKNTSNLFDEEL